MKIFPKALFQVLVFAVLSHLIGSSAGAQGAPSGGSAGAVQASDSYVISPLDYLRVALFVADEVQFQTELRVSQAGTITVPHLGTIDIAGKSIDEAREALYDPYDRDYYVNPHIDITVLQYSERTVTVIGKVNRQGQIPFPSEKGLSLLEAIAMAGGWSNDRLADKSSVTITRTGDNGERSVIEVDARKLTTEDHQLEEGDLINVPERIW
jgi:protein involved in polysaccharide export with SLBB domain